MKKLFCLTLLVAVIGVYSCKKNDISPGVKEKLAAHTWKSTLLVKDGVSQTTWCWKNYQYNFTTGGKVFIEISANGGGCISPPSGTILKYPYTLSADEKWVVINEIDPAEEIDSFLIVSISETNLSTKRVVGKASPPAITWEDTFTAIP